MCVFSALSQWFWYTTWVGYLCSAQLRSAVLFSTLYPPPINGSALSWKAGPSFGTLSTPLTAQSPQTSIAFAFWTLLMYWKKVSWAQDSDVNLRIKSWLIHSMPFRAHFSRYTSQIHFEEIKHLKNLNGLEMWLSDSVLAYHAQRPGFYP